MPHRRVTLQQLYLRARRDRKFFRALMNSPKKAMAKKRLALTPGDMKKLERALKRIYRISGKELAKILIFGTVRPPHPWPQIKPWPITGRPWP